MAVLALTDAYIYIDSHDFTGDSNEVRLACEGEQLDKTTFASGGWREFVLGLKTSTLTAGGHWQSASEDAVDPEIFPNLGTGKVVTLGDVQTEGQMAAMVKSMPVNYQPFRGSVGEIAGYGLQGACSDGVGVIHGQLAVEKTTITTTGAKGTALNLGLIGAGQYLYSTLHLFGTAGSSITAVVESDVDDTWGSATTRITFGPLTAVGGTWGTRVAGAIADDDWFRLNVTAISGTWTIACAIGIQ